MVGEAGVKALPVWASATISQRPEIPLQSWDAFGLPEEPAFRS
jgi:hypothetical protein